jgi:hypothetical protein
VATRERRILEQAVQAAAEQAAKADDLVDEAIEVGHGRFDPLVTHAKMLRLGGSPFGACSRSWPNSVRPCS